MTVPGRCAPRVQAYRMDTPKAHERLGAIRGYLRSVAHATIPQLVEATGLPVDSLRPYLKALIETGEIARADVPGLKPASHAYRFVADLADTPEKYPPRQRRVAAGDWPRGEHARCTGVPVFFPARG